MRRVNVKYEKPTFFPKDPRVMARSAVVRDYRALEVGRRRANRLVLTVTG